MTWGAYSLRWLAKGFETFGIQGSLSDVANLICGMLGMRMPRPGQAAIHIGEVVRNVGEFENMLLQKQFDRLQVVPTHVLHDAELDDALALVLVTLVNRLKPDRQMKPYVLLQLPYDASLERLKQAFATRMRLQNTQVYTDPAARNAEAIMLFWGL